MSAWHGFMSSSSFHEKAGECQVFLCFFLFFVVSFFKLFPLSQAASVATLVNAVLVEVRYFKWTVSRQIGSWATSGIQTINSKRVARDGS
jgi:hypothetical protein